MEIFIKNKQTNKTFLFGALLKYNIYTCRVPDKLNYEDNSVFVNLLGETVEE